MKKLLIIATMAVSLSAFGQGGMFLFQGAVRSVWDWWSASALKNDASNNVSFLIGSGTPLVDTVWTYANTGSGPSGSGTNAAWQLPATTIWNAILGDPNYSLAQNYASSTTPVQLTSATGGWNYNSSTAFPVTGTSTAGGSISVYVIGWAANWNGSSYATPAAAALAGAPVGWSAPFTYAYQSYPAGTPGAFTAASGWYQFAVEPVPEPASIALAGLGGLALLMLRRRH